MKMTCPGHMVWAGALLVLSAISAFADLDEEEFQQYSTGDLGGQRGWDVTVKDVRDNEGAQIVQDGTGRQYVEIVGLKEAGGGLTRILKKFPPTNGGRVVVKLDFTPGSESLDGRLFFEQVGVSNVLAVSFLGGTLKVVSFEDSGSDVAGSANGREVDTEVLFEPLKKNRLEVWLNFESHDFKVYLNGVLAGDFPLADVVQGVDLVNLYGAGDGVVSRLENLSVTSVSSFPEHPH